MKSLSELAEKRQQLRDAIEAIIAKGEKEGRKLNADETSEYELKIAELNAIDDEIRQTKEAQENLKKNINKTNTKGMEKKKFSLFETVRSLANNTELSEVSKIFVRDGKIVIPSEKRTAVAVGTDGATVEVEVSDMFGALRDNSVLVQAGAKMLTGLSGDVKIPVLGGATAQWEKEVATAKDGNEAITSVTLKPKRIACVVPISKQFLIQDASSAEAMIQADIANAVVEKLQATILGKAVGSDTQPAGIGNGKTASKVTDFASVTKVEAKIEGAKFGNLAYICSPTAKAALRAMSYNKNGRIVYEGGTVDGVPAYCTSAVAENEYYVGDFSNLVIGQFGNIEITVDPYTLSADGEVRLVVNAFFDAQMARKNAVELATFATA